MHRITHSYMSIRYFSICLFVILVNHAAEAQLCQGSLGDPIVYTTFGSGANPGPSLATAATTYQYTGGDCPLDGFYTIRNNTSNCFGSSWYTLTSDHTGDPSGYFMLVNASVQPGVFYIDTVRGLCSNSTYEFAAWIMNVIIPSTCSGNAIQPDLTFTIEKTDGTVLQTYNTGSIAATQNAVWKQYGNFFTTPAGISEVVLRIVNNAPGGCGNDLALDDITFRACGPALNPFISGGGGASVSLCEGIAGSFTFSCNVSAGYNQPVYQWQQRVNNGAWSDIAGETVSTLQRNFPASAPAGTYDFRLLVAESGNIGSIQCRISSAPLRVTIHTNPVTGTVSNSPLCEADTLQLTASGGSQYAWTGPGGFNASGASVSLANMVLQQAGMYYVVVTSEAGCTARDSAWVAINAKPAASTSFANILVCAGDSVQLAASGGVAYMWFPPAGIADAAMADPKASPGETTHYSVVVTNLFGCTDTASSVVTVFQIPVADAGPDKQIIQGQQVQLTGSVNDAGHSFTWIPAMYIDDEYSLQPFVNPPADMNYVLRVTSGAGCGVSTDTVFVKVYKGLFVPNAFSPNGDGINDTWNIPALAAYASFEVSVYNRWGEKVYHTRNTLKPWDGNLNGKQLPAGVYNYIISFGNKESLIKGTVMIIR